MMTTLMGTTMTTTTAITTLSIFAVLELLYIVGKWNLFKKMNLSGWKALIPVYSEYLIYKKAWCGKMFFAGLFTSVCGGTLAQLAVHGSNTNVALALVSLAFLAATTVIGVKALYKLAKAFGHGVGYTLGLIVAEPLFTMILGFGKSEYVAA